VSTTRRAACDESSRFPRLLDPFGM
jgi:hypothetical protein